MSATHVVHKIRLEGRASKYSVWYRADMGTKIESSLTYVVDAERIDRLGRSFPCTQKEKDELWHYRHNAKRI